MQRYRLIAIYRYLSQDNIAILTIFNIMNRLNISGLRKSLKMSQEVFRKEICGISQSYLSELETGKKELTESLYDTIVEKLGIDKVTPFIETNSYNIADDIFKVPTEVIAKPPQKKKIPFYDDVATIGGTNHLVANDNPEAIPSEWIDAGDWFPEATAAIRHYGDSMIEYPSGSILALKRVNDHRLIIWGRNYSIETTEFRITKRLQDGGDDYIMAYSSNVSTNPDGTLIHSPIRIPKDTIRHIDLVLGCVTKEYSNGPIKIIK